MTGDTTAGVRACQLAVAAGALADTLTTAAGLVQAAVAAGAEILTAAKTVAAMATHEATPDEALTFWFPVAFVIAIVGVATIALPPVTAVAGTVAVIVSSAVME